MKTIRYTLSVAWKEILIISKDRGTLAIMVMLPLLLGSIFGGINYQLNKAGEDPNILFEVYIVNNDPGKFGGQLQAALEDIELFKILNTEDVESVEQEVAEGNAAAAIIIPASFSSDIDSYSPTKVEVIVDPAVPESAEIITGILNQASTEITIWGEIQYGVRTILDESGVLEGADTSIKQAVEGQTLGVIMTQLNELRRSPAILVDNKTLEGITVEGGIELFFAVLFPGFAVMFIFFILSFASSSLLMERESGALRRILAAPIPKGTVIAGKMIAYMTLACFQVALLFTLGSIVFDMPLGNSPVSLVLLTLATAFVATAMGVFVASVSKNSSQAGNIGIILAFILAALGGALPLSNIPLTRTEGFISVISKFTPHAHAVEGYYRVMAENAGLAQVWIEVLILIAIGIIFSLLATWRFKFEQ
jgi:ABC-2 type transport system permease protein